MLQRLLLLPLLTPLLAVLLVGALNPRPWVSLRLLIWSSPSWPLGGWIASAAAVGAGLSAAGTALALNSQPPSLGPRRQVRRRPDSDEPQPRQDQASSRPRPDPQPAWAGPSRSAGEPAPTVSVPFRVIRKPKSAPPRPAAATAPAAAASPAASAGPDDWNSPSSDDW